jgi:predicted dehydrogenase
VEACVAENPHVIAAPTAAALIDDSGIDCVYIASPPASHLELANRALDAGRAVFCEKPLAVDAEEARATIERIGREGHRAAVNFSLAASAGLATLLAAVAREEAGALRAIEIEVAFKEWPRPWQSAAGRWLAEREEGGFTREVLSHFVFALQRALGTAVVEEAQARYPDDGAGAETGLAARLRAGAIPVKVGGRVGGELADFNRFALVGDRSTIAFTEWLGKRDGQPVDAGGRLSYLRQLDELVAFVEGRSHPLPDFAEALAVQETIEALLAA